MACLLWYLAELLRLAVTWQSPLTFALTPCIQSPAAEHPVFQTHQHWTWQPFSMFEQHVRAAAAGGGQPGSTTQSQSQPAPLLLLLPEHLPACTIAASQLHDRYVIRQCSPTMLLHCPLADPAEAMQSWWTRPVQLDRPGRLLTPRTWRNLLDGMALCPASTRASLSPC